MKPIKNVLILGATGSIGTQTVDVIRSHPDRLRLWGAVAHWNAGALKNLGAEFPEAKLLLADEDAAATAGLPGGMDAMVDLVVHPEVDLVVVSVAGVIGLVPTLAAIDAGKQIALASKEVLVAAGELVMPKVREKGTFFTPIDSEHSAIFQCVQGYRLDQIDSLMITASGGPFFGKTRAELQNITPEQALKHPTWAMGGKITIDSATLFNKALEMIEARWLFDVPMDRVELTVHPQSIIHSMVRLTDGSVLGQMGWPNMRLPIQYALLYPERPPSGLKTWNPVDSPQLTFFEPDLETFPGPRLGREAMRSGGTMPCAFNAANEAAANAFLQGRIPFLAIDRLVAEVMEQHIPLAVNLENLLEVDTWARAEFEQRAREPREYN